MQQTENYQLGLWELSDQVTHEAFNENTVKIDSALAELAEGVAEAATAARVAVGTYTGNGKSGSKYPQKLTFSFKPKFLMVWGDGLYCMKGIQGQILGIDAGSDSEALTMQTNTTWGSNYVSWYNGTYGDTTTYGFCQMNTKDAVYSYIAIG